MIEIRQTEAFATWRRALRDPRAQAAIASRIARAQLGNFGDAKPIGEGVSEMRIHYGPGYRLYYVRRGRELIILLCGGSKGSQAGDTETALKLAKEV